MTGPGTCHLVFRLEGVVTRTESGARAVTPGMGELLKELSSDFKMWLFCEGAEEELAPILEGLQLERVIPRIRWLFASELFRADIPGRLIRQLVRRTAARREDLLWIDDRPSVTAGVIRAGMNAAVFVDAFRLRRNLVLRGLVK